MDHSIFGSSESDLKFAAGKLTYLGPQEKPIPTVLFSTVGYAPPLDRFALFQGGRKRYQNDDPGNIRRFSVTPREFHSILAAVRDLVKAPTGGRPDFVSLVLLEKDDQGGEFQITRADGPAFYRAVQGALDRENELGRNLLWAQERNVLPGQ
jgi:hypothetical protein